MNMEFNYSANQYCSFKEASSIKYSFEETDEKSFFETTHIEHEPIEMRFKENDEVFFTPNKVETESLSSPNNTSVTADDKPQPVAFIEQPVIRRSLSCNSLILKKVNVTKNAEVTKFPKQRSNSFRDEEEKKKHVVRRFASNENLNKLAQPKKKDKGSYVSLAEAVNNFQRGTPPRFHTSNGTFRPFKMSRNGPTVPFSPHLITKHRSRPVNALTREEEEILEYQEAAKFKIKAHPLNRKILKGPLKPMVVVKKTPTKPSPFKLTEPVKKEKSLEKKFEFHAKPVPKTVSQPIPALKKETKATAVQPFSFEQRDLELKKKKEEFIKNVIEEEKKAAIFHANPVPKKITNSRNTSRESITSPAKKMDDSNTKPVFKARPATVLTAPPFVPKKRDTPLTESVSFHLNTEQRLLERQEFERKLKEKEQLTMELRKQQEEERKRLEELEIAEIRKNAVIKAQPIKKYKDVRIVKSSSVTEPMSPPLSYRQKKNKSATDSPNKENINF